MKTRAIAPVAATLVLIAVAPGLPSGLTAEVLLPLSGAQEEACSAPEHRQFDFWIGDWEVSNPEGRVVGTNRITSILGGCVLKEEWTSAGQHAGTSYNIYDAANRKWHQTWVDTGGLLLELDGGLEERRMVLSGQRPGREGGTILHRISWEPLENGDVRQLWETSQDGGETWKGVFEGRYTKRK